MAARVRTTRATVSRRERGELSVSIALLARVWGVLGLAGDRDRIGSEDELGRRLQDARLTRPRGPQQNPVDG